MTTKTIDQRELRNAFGRFATGVTVITAKAPNGQLCGLTANSFSSVSLDPPLVLWSLDLSSPNMQMFCDCSHFAINILASDQVALSNQFATPNEDKFTGVNWTPGIGGAPVLPGTIATFECKNVTQHEGGDHLIFIGAVENFSYNDGAPLLFSCGQYGVSAAHPDAG